MFTGCDLICSNIRGRYENNQKLSGKGSSAQCKMWRFFMWLDSCQCSNCLNKSHIQYWTPPPIAHCNIEKFCPWNDYFHLSPNVSNTIFKKTNYRLCYPCKASENSTDKFARVIWIIRATWEKLFKINLSAVIWSPFRALVFLCHVFRPSVPLILYSYTMAMV